ncbi:eCIS core domain-containing protein [Flavivirga eckloniae]|uniref:eCIS core domain-containing protein n=1 Tax=Flavivirga eckloniae TaxID=1803846 RepID=A0A2K9PPT9_9FLAO|nr:DUF4157 domain-containing protein [Flavivirga eckloniae]AUP79059.1 hypothetical protein C1H87_10255 [Flavivirga eckloniae]
MERATLYKKNLTQGAKINTSFFKPTIQKKLSVGASNDAYEVEADNMANKVMRAPNPKREQATYTGALIQRKCAACEQEEKIQKKPLAENITPLIQRSSDLTSPSGDGGLAPSHIESQINSSKGSGSTMDHGTKNFMESRFGTDFSDVKIHTGSQAVQMSRELNAQAFTVGNDIYFNEGKYSPNSDNGKHLLAHELTHTVQQTGGLNKKLNAPLIQKQAANPPRKTLWVNVGFDSSASASTATMRKLRSSIALLSSSVRNCCSARAKACDVDVKTAYDWNRNNKPAPADGDYDGDVAADSALRDSNINNINTGRAGGMKVLVTNSSLSQTWQGVRIFASANTDANGVIWNASVAPNETMAHETGHFSGYSGGDIEGGAHSSDPDNIMSRGDIRNAGALPDLNWCEKVAALAV